MGNAQLGDWMKSVCADLHIPFIESDLQDWGIIHADGARVQAFITYYNTTSLSSLQQFFVFELIVASYNEVIINQTDSYQLREEFIKIVRQSNASQRLDIIKDYWRNLNDSEYYPVGDLLNNFTH